jgi:cysteinyl-tRNA synthetase
MHNEMLQVEGKKMSKSLGNFFTVRDLLDQGVDGEVIRFVMLSTHYRKPMDWTERKRDEAAKTLAGWRALIRDAAPVPVPEAVIDALCDDLNTSRALSEMHALAKSAKSDAISASALAAAMAFMGFTQTQAPARPEADLGAYADHLANLRIQAMQDKDFAKVDAFKAMLVAAGVQVQMTKEGVQLEPLADFDPDLLGNL